MIDYTIDLNLNLKDIVVQMVNISNNTNIDPNKTFLFYDGETNSEGDDICYLEDSATNIKYKFTYSKVPLNFINNFDLKETLAVIDEIVSLIRRGEKPHTYLDENKKRIIGTFKRECLSSALKNIIFWEYADDANNVYDVSWNTNLNKFVFKFPSFVFNTKFTIYFGKPSYEYIANTKLNGVFIEQYANDVVTDIKRNTFKDMSFDGDDIYI